MQRDSNGSRVGGAGGESNGQLQGAATDTIESETESKVIKNIPAIPKPNHEHFNSKPV